MAIRTTAIAVIECLGDNYDQDKQPSLNGWMRRANIVVNRVVTCATTKGITLTTEELTEIETCLAAHFYQMMDPAYTSKSAGGASGSFNTSTGMYLEGTRYGQMAVALDYSGCLNSIGNRKTAEMMWLGKPPSEQIDYELRN